MKGSVERPVRSARPHRSFFTTLLLALLLAACGSVELPPPAVSQLKPPEVKVGTNTPLPAHAVTHTPTSTLSPFQSPTPSLEPTATPTLEPTTIALAGQFDVSPPSSELAALAQAAFGANLPTRLVIPAIGVDTAVVPVGWHVQADGQTVWDSPGYAAGFLVSSAAPGQGGNIVFYGHNNILGAIFRNLSSLQPGNEITIINGVASWQYAVERADIFQVAGTSGSEQLAQTAFFASTPDERVTLLSCYPFTNNTHRVAVVAKRAP